MKFLEKNLEQIIFESYDKLNERGLFDGINFNTETGYHLKNEGF